MSLADRGAFAEAAELLRGLLASSAPERATIYGRRLEAMLQQVGVRFFGEVSQGQHFAREFDSKLVFGLRPSRDPVTPGWTIEVRPKGETNLEIELSWVVTPPYRFFNPRYLEVSYGYTAREIVEMNVREFSFLREPADFARAAEARRSLLWPDGIPAPELQRAEKLLNAVPTCKGTLRILDHRIGANNTIEWLKFEVALCLDR